MNVNLQPVAHLPPPSLSLSVFLLLEQVHARLYSLGGGGGGSQFGRLERKFSTLYTLWGVGGGGWPKIKTQQNVWYLFLCCAMDGTVGQHSQINQLIGTNYKTGIFF